jgi:hypothetical protein
MIAEPIMDSKLFGELICLTAIAQPHIELADDCE